MTTGTFITLEGGEGAGKTTLLLHITSWLIQRQIKFITTREPGGTRLAEQVRNILLHQQELPVTPQAELLLMFAARAQNLAETIRPALAAGRVVLCDRFTDASFAYQGGGRKLGSAMVAQLEAVVHPDLQPDLTLLLDLPAATGMARKHADQPDRIESEQAAFFQRVRDAYLQRAAEAPGRIKIINAEQTEKKVASSAIEHIEKLFKSK